jgi:hypothetical protein
MRCPVRQSGSHPRRIAAYEIGASNVYAEAHQKFGYLLGDLDEPGRIAALSAAKGIIAERACAQRITRFRVRSGRHAKDSQRKRASRVVRRSGTLSAMDDFVVDTDSFDGQERDHA